VDPVPEAPRLAHRLRSIGFRPIGLVLASLWLAAAVGGRAAADAGSVPTVSDSARAPAFESLNLILSSAGDGELLPCGRCTSKAGGLARRATLIRACRDTADHVLVADGGDFLRKGGRDPQLDQFQVDMMVRRLYYTVFGVGEIELSRGEPYLRELLQAHPGAQWVSCNILDRATQKPRFAPYVTKRTGQAVIGFTSVLEPVLAPAGLDSALYVAEAGPALQNTVDAMRAECDLVVVLGHLRHMPLRALIESVTGVDIVVSSHAKRIENYPMRIGDVRQVFYGGVDGRFQNWSNIVITPEEVFPYGGRTFYLRDHVPNDSTVTRELVAFFGTDSPPPAEDDEDGGGVVEEGAAGEGSPPGPER
jgi:2',3'-cyclic-nucleotide 2'-phosphodiesterase (5'-nucleotidase family)